MERLLGDSCEPSQMSSASLAFIGDAVFSLMVRERLCCTHRLPAGKLHLRAVHAVRCEGQARAAELFMDSLSEEERAVYLRGRNSHNSHVPKNASIADYRSATGVEALFGYLYLKGDLERLRELFAFVELD